MKEQSYVMIKPDFANKKCVIEEIQKRLTENGLTIVTASYVKYDKERAQRHYHEHIEKDFYPNVEKYIISDKAYGMIVEGENAISVVRKLAGSTKDPKPGTIRYDIPNRLGLQIRITENVVHSSDSKEAAGREIEIFKELSSEKCLSSQLVNSLDK